MGKIAVFAYGSLVDPGSAALTLGRAVERPDPAELRGWVRRWSIWRDNLAHEKTFAIQPGGELPPAILGLSIEPSRDPSAPAPNGALLEVSAAELQRLDLREMRYDRIDVTGAVDGGDHGFDAVVAYRAKAEHRAPDPPAGAVVLAPYLRTVELAFGELGPEELAAFRQSTGPPPVPAVEATLVRDRIPAGNPRSW